LFAFIYRSVPLLPVLILLPLSVSAQTNPAAVAARQWRQQHERAIVEEFVSFR
jgi:hypothetical protein